MPFPGGLAPSETQTTSFKIWTLVSDSISHDDNRYAFLYIFLYIYFVHYCRFNKKINGNGLFVYIPVKLAYLYQFMKLVSLYIL